MITKLTEKITERLKGTCGKTDIKVISAPMKPEEYRRYTKSAIVVSFVNLTEESSLDLYTFDISAISRHLNKNGEHAGMMPLGMSVKNALDGYKPDIVGVTALRLQSITFLEGENSVWIYTMRYTIKSAN